MISDGAALTRKSLGADTGLTKREASPRISTHTLRSAATPGALTLKSAGRLVRSLPADLRTALEAGHVPEFA